MTERALTLEQLRDYVGNRKTDVFVLNDVTI